MHGRRRHRQARFQQLELRPARLQPAPELCLRFAERFRLADPLQLIAGMRVTQYRQNDVTPTWWNYNMRETVTTPYAWPGFTGAPECVAVRQLRHHLPAAKRAERTGPGAGPRTRSKTYELGAKGEFFDQRLNANIRPFLDEDHQHDHVRRPVASPPERWPTARWMAPRAVAGSWSCPASWRGAGRCKAAGCSKAARSPVRQHLPQAPVQAGQHLPL